MLYFAYGSNLNFVRMRERCPSTRFECIAVLERHKLTFPRKSESPKSTFCGSGVASIEPDDEQNVWGVVYQIDELDIDRLDKKEGYIPNREHDKNKYIRCKRQALRCGDKESPLTVFTYVAIAQIGGPFLPTQSYMNHILNGAEHWHLPPEYIAILKQTEISK